MPKKSEKNLFKTIIALIVILLLAACTMPMTESKSSKKSTKDDVQITIEESKAGSTAKKAKKPKSSDVTSNKTGNSTDYMFYSYWKNGGTGTLKISEVNKYTLTWDATNPNNVNSGYCIVAGKGWMDGVAWVRQFNYNASYNVTKGSSYLAFYGWGWTSTSRTVTNSSTTNRPIFEFYILENFAGNNPMDSATDKVFKGTYNVDGSDYDMYVSTRNNQPWAVDSNPYSTDDRGYFYQYWAIRKTLRTSGDLHAYLHFMKWRDDYTLGVDNFTNFYQIMATEGNNSAGSCTITLMPLNPM